ncbi:uncharacterized protein FIBRA_01778 [Fibroporia radiculosa]|uniref:F-box domain-containing protein n=1 Tax=Fibroporia radiculosa TaxID=599839 RepID=J4I8P2_9APHY|nr:uncharacterized protein FIBRA_01778 [Fibroporia radiculosa]CCL99756.1 predicted protein [Fibroporia radiculosa]
MATNIELAISSVLQRGEPLIVANVLVSYLKILGYMAPDTRELTVPHEALVAFEHALDKEPVLSLRHGASQTQCTVIRRRMYTAEIAELRKTYWKERLGMTSAMRCTCPSCGSTLTYRRDELEEKLVDAVSSQRFSKDGRRKLKKKKVIKRRQDLKGSNPPLDPYGPSTSAFGCKTLTAFSLSISLQPKATREGVRATSIDDLGGMSKSSQMLPTLRHALLPIEVWESMFNHIIGDFYLDHRQKAEMLRACSMVCKRWNARCRFLLWRHVVLLSKKHVAGMAKMIQRRPSLKDVPRTVTLCNLDMLSAFATRMVRKLPQVEELELLPDETPSTVKWSPGMFNANTADVFLYLSAFTSVTRLSLFHVQFPSPVIFARLICAFPRLSHLSCRWVQFLNFDSHSSRELRLHHRLPGVKCPTGLTLTHLRLESQDIDDVVDVLIATTIGTTVKHVGFPDGINTLDAGCKQRLVEVAGESLSSMHIGNVSSTRTTLNFKRSTNLQGLSFTVQHGDTAAIEWLCNILSDSVSEDKVLKLSKVMIVFAPLRDRGLSRKDIWDAVLNFNEEAYLRLDRLLSGPQFANITTVCFEFIKIDELFPSVDEFWAALSARFPRLIARGVFRWVALRSKS